MSVYGELDHIAEHRTQFAFKGKREHIARVNMPNIAYPNQHSDNKILHGSRDHVIVPDTLKITFNLDIESIDKTRSTAMGVGAKKTDGTALTVTIKKTFDKRFAIPLDLDFFKHPVYPYGLKEDLIVRLELNSSEKAILYTGDTSGTYNLSGILLEYDAIFDELYATSIGEMYTRTTSIPYTKVTSIHYQTLCKKDTTWKIDENNLSVRSLQGLLLLFLNKRDDFANKNEEFYNPSIKKTLVTINGMSHQLFAAGLQEREIYPELSQYVYKEDSDVAWEDFLTTN